MVCSLDNLVTNLYLFLLVCYNFIIITYRAKNNVYVAVCTLTAFNILQCRYTLANFINSINVSM